MHQHVEGQSQGLPTQQPGEQNEVSRAADGKKLGNPLENTQKESLHGVIHRSGYPSFANEESNFAMLYFQFEVPGFSRSFLILNLKAGTWHLL